MIKNRFIFPFKFVRRRRFSSCPLPLEPLTPSSPPSSYQTTHKDLCFSLAELLLSRGLFSSARKVIQRLISQSPSVPEAISAVDFVFSRGMDLDSVTYGTLIRKLVISGEAHMAETLYVDCVVTKGLKPDHNLLNSMIICYCKLGKLNDAKDTFDRLIESKLAPWVGSCNALMKVFVLQDRFMEAYDCFCEISEANDTVLNFACYNRLVDGLCKRGFLDEGLHVFDVMVEMRVMPTVNVCKSLLIGFCKWGRVEEAEVLSMEIESYGFVVDEFMYTYLINSYCKGKKLKMAMRLYMRMLKMGYEPDTYVYNTLIHGFINLGLHSEGWFLHNKMVSSGSKPNLVTYQIMLHTYCRDGKVYLALKLLDEMVKCNIAPNVHCYTVLISALCKEQKFKEVYQLYHKMLDSGVIPDHVLFFMLVKNHPEGDELGIAHTVLQTIAKESCNIDNSSVCTSRLESMKDDAMVEIKCLLDEIAKSGSGLADMAFSIYMIALCMGGKIDSALDCMEKMVSLDLVPSHTAFNSLIKLLIEEGLVESAESLLKVMRDQGIVPNQLTFSIIVSELCKKGNFSSSIDVLYQIEENGIKPSVIIYNSIIGCLGRLRMIKEAEKFFYKMLQFGIDPDETVFVTMINTYSKNGWANEAQNLFEKMMDYNIRPNCSAYTALIPGLVKKNMTKKSCFYLYRMLRDGFVPNVVLYTSLIKQFLRKRELEFAFRLFDLMNKSEVEQDFVTYITLLSGVCRNICRYNGHWYLSNEKLDNSKEILFHLLNRKAILAERKRLRVLIGSEAEMKSFGLKLIQKIKKVSPVLDLYLYNGIISGLCWAHGMREAHEHLNRMEGEGVSPNHVTFTILIEGHIQFGEVNNAVALFNRMNAIGVGPDRMLFNTLIRGFCKSGRFLDALSLSHTMRKRGFSPSKLTYEKLLCFLCSQGSGVDALKVFEDMVAEDYFPCRYNARFLSSVLREDCMFDEARGVQEMVMNRGNYRMIAGPYSEHKRSLMHQV